MHAERIHNLFANNSPKGIVKTSFSEEERMNRRIILLAALGAMSFTVTTEAKAGCYSGGVGYSGSGGCASNFKPESRCPTCGLHARSYAVARCIGWGSDGQFHFIDSAGFGRWSKKAHRPGDRFWASGGFGPIVFD